MLLGGVVASVGAWLSLGHPYLHLGALGTVTSAAFAPRTIGTARIPDGIRPGPREVRKWRKEHPGATITEAIAAVAEW